MKILEGIDDLVIEWLAIERKGKPPHYQHVTTAIELSRRKEPLTGTAEFLEACYAKIHSNWRTACETGQWKRSRENWRWEARPDIPKENKRPEVTLERTIVRNNIESWSNQMPTASGLAGSYAGKTANVDLVRRDGPDAYSFIELKVERDTPLFAAIEILKYGLLFVWSKNNYEKLGYDLDEQPVLAADIVTLRVLAPASYYARYNVTNLAVALQDGLIHFKQRRKLTLGFEFDQLGERHDDVGAIKTLAIKNN